ncbi:MAG: hypothetical protein CM1200mP18_18260 [Gammaproteobacteria bacterium]|nr:MAG: hypothetical protein CM1200mP18_18260 [Gammaproteobacteria bacterium]
MTSEKPSQLRYSNSQQCGLSSDHRCLKGLEQWHPEFLDWWHEWDRRFSEFPVYLRTAVSVERDGWAQFGYVKMPDYRWGVLLAPQIEGRTIGFGHYMGEPVWQKSWGTSGKAETVIVIQGDTEPASVEHNVTRQNSTSLYDFAIYSR